MKNQIQFRCVSTFRLLLLFIAVVGSIYPSPAQSKEVENKLQDLFFNLSFHVDIDVIRLELKSNDQFKVYEDPNRDSKKSIVGTIIKDKKLNPVSSSNQFIVLYSGRKKKNVSLKWSINYKLEDLASAAVDYEKFKSEFRPLFKEFKETFQVGQQKEQIELLTLRADQIIVLIRLMTYNNFIHTISIEYKDTWKITPIDIIK